MARIGLIPVLISVHRGGSYPTVSINTTFNLLARTLGSTAFGDDHVVDEAEL